MKQNRIGAWIALIIGALYFIVPLLGTLEFSLRMRRGEYSFDAYRIVLADPGFQASFLYSCVLALATIVVGVLLVVPTVMTPSALNAALPPALPGSSEMESKVATILAAPPDELPENR